MSNNDIELKIIKMVRKHFGENPDKIDKTTRFFEDLNADSLATVEFVMDLEEEFKIDIPQEEAEKILTIGAAIELIESKQQNTLS